MKINKTQKGSALIIALLIMGILMTLALGLSDLVIREVRITTDIVNSTKAYYAAEAGIESALLDLHQNLPGFENEGGMFKGKDENGHEIGEDLDFEYSIANKAHTIPYVDTEVIDRDIAQELVKTYQYNVLELNDTLTIPLFVDDGGVVKDIKNFRVEFFIDAVIDLSKYGDAVQKKWVDILRWKINGINENNPRGKSIYTESIGDFLPVLPNSDEKSPMCFGTEPKQGKPYKDPDSKINYPENCNDFIWQWARESYVFDFNKDGVLVTEARIDDTGENGTGRFDPIRIDQFLLDHTTNYLTLTNIFNPQVIQERTGVTKADQAKIYYRIIVPDEEVIREFAKVKATGIEGKLRKQIEAFIRPDSFMPVFNFSLYRTQVGEKGSVDKETPQGFIDREGAL